MRAAVAIDGPVFLRLSRMPVPTVTAAAPPFEIGRAVTLRPGRDLTIIAAGVTVGRALAAADAPVVGRHRCRGDEPVDHPTDRSRRDRRGGEPRSDRHGRRAHGATADSAAPSPKSWSTTHPVRMRLMGVPGVFAPTGIARVPARSLRPRPAAKRRFSQPHGQPAKLACGLATEGPRAMHASRAGHRPGHDQHEGVPVRRARRGDGTGEPAGADRVSPRRLGRAGRRRHLAQRGRCDRATACQRRRARRSPRSPSPTSANPCCCGRGPPGSPSGPVIVWQCRRTTDFCETLRDRGLQAQLEAATGLTIDPLFSASKLRWLLTTLPGAMARAERGELCAGTIDSWLIWNLTRRRRPRLRCHERVAHAAAEPAHRGGWDPDLLVAVLDPGRHPAGSRAIERHLRRGHGDSRARGRSDRQRDWRFACRALRTRRLCAGPGEGDLRHGLVADDGRARARPLATRALDHHRLERRRQRCSTRWKATSR